MYKIFSFFKIIDEKSFVLVNDFKQHEFYINLNQKISGLDETYQKLIRNSLFIFLVFLPVFIMLITSLMIYNKHSTISDKQEIMNLIDHQMVLIKQVDQYSEGLLSNQALTSEEDLKSNISSNPVIANIIQKLSFDNFTQTPIAGNYNSSELTIKFSEISTPDLANLVKFLFENYKARITQVVINRNAQKKLLQGELYVHIISN